MTRTPRIAIVGASGYTGREVRSLLHRHPGVQVDLTTTARTDYTPPPPDLPYDAAVEPLRLSDLQYVDAAIVCAPHGAAVPLVRAALEHDCKVVDLSADFRLRDADLYAAHYGQPHAAPELLDDAVYGLTEHYRTAVKGGRLIANPGCYPTSILLPLLPLLHSDLLAPDVPIIADAKSGVSGAGKTPSERTVYGNVHDNCSAYGIGTHRHTPEIHARAGTDRIVFVPHLLPLFRGMLTTLYLAPAPGVDAAAMLAHLDEHYAAEPFVRVYPTGTPSLDRVQHTNFCDIGAADAGDRVVVVAAIDNLGKGAAGQAVQNLNVLLGLPETMGLTSAGLGPAGSP